jgi:hypothetical protein
MALSNPIFRSAGNGGSSGPDIPVKRILMWALIAIVVLIVGSIAGCGIKVVNTGHRGIETRFGKVVPGRRGHGRGFHSFPCHPAVKFSDPNNRRNFT